MVTSYLDDENNFKDNILITKKKHLIFNIHDKRFAIPLVKVKEVIKILDITPLPHVPDFYKGLINLRGKIISVIDLRTKLGFSDLQMDEKKTSIIISHVGEILIGSIVDEVVEVLGYSEADIEYSEVSKASRHGNSVLGVAKESNGDLTLIIDIEKTLDKSDFKVLLENEEKSVS